MDLQTQLLELYKIALENSRPFDDGLEMPYSCMTLTNNGYHLSCFKTVVGDIQIQLNTPNYKSNDGFSLYRETTGEITGHVYVDGEIKFIKEKDEIWSSQNIYLEQLNEQNPQAVQQAIQRYKLEVSELTKDEKRTESSRAYHTKRMAEGHDRWGRPITEEAKGRIFYL